MAGTMPGWRRQCPRWKHFRCRRKPTASNPREVGSRFIPAIVAQYSGDLAIGLALSEPFAPWDLMTRPDETNAPGSRGRSERVRERLGVAIETAKLRQLQAPAAQAVLMAEYPAGECPVCGVRPAREAADGPGPCVACAAEAALGARLPRSRAVVIGADTARGDQLLGLDYLLPIGDGAGQHDRERGWRWRRAAGHGPAPVHPGPAWVARYRDGDAQRYADLARRTGAAFDDADIGADQIKSFQALALDAAESDIDGRACLGQPMLALLKGDVDRLGKIFAHGLGERWSVARTAQLSRMMDVYFSLRLPHLLERQFTDSYMVYAGGDDFLLVLPWRQGFALAGALSRDFSAFAGGNPDLTFSLGVALFGAHTPVSIAAREAEARLETAKAAGRNRVSAVERDPMADALGAENGAAAREVVRGLVDAIVLVPEGGRLRVEVRGALAAILALCAGARNDKSPGMGAEALVGQVKLVAGERNFRQFALPAVNC